MSTDKIKIEYRQDYDEYLLRSKGIIRITGELYEGLLDEIDKVALSLSNQDNKRELTLSIASTGGSVFNGLSVIRGIKKYQKQGFKFTGLVEGYALSMAFILLQCCDVRIMGKYDVLMCHGASGISIGDRRNLEAERKLVNKFTTDFSEIIASRNTALEKIYHEASYWATILDEDTPQYYDSNESLSMGVVDFVEDY